MDYRALINHPHLNQPVKNGYFKVDLHCHSYFSGDCVTTFEEFTDAIKGAGLDIVALTDHNTVVGALGLKEGMEKSLIVGQEQKSTKGELIGLFLNERLPALKNPFELATCIKDQGGIVYVPHPFDVKRHSLDEKTLHLLVERKLIDIIEVFNSKNRERTINEKAARFAQQHNIAVAASSDAHVPEAFGAAYCIMPQFENKQEFLAALKFAEPVGHYFDPPRVWRNKIVPSVNST
jgi:predicted metal-dependent phosphoesterase TrpH